MKTCSLTSLMEEKRRKRKSFSGFSIMFRNKTPIKVGKMFISGKQIATEKLLKRLQTVLEAVTERL